jgi:hypothetical protein
MNSHNEPDKTSLHSGEERRSNTNLRHIFEKACSVTAPLLDRQQGGGGEPLILSALRVLRDHFPDLPQQDIAILFASVKRFHKGG